MATVAFDAGFERKLGDEEGGASRDMDAELWGRLQLHIGLERVFAKLPFREFFQLRLVCKEWNRLAGDRAFLDESFREYLIPKPYFVLDAQGFDDKVRGLLARDRSSGLWSWTRLPSSGSTEFWSMSGLVYSDVELSNDERVRKVFNLHTRLWLTLPPPVEITLNSHPFTGMIVDTSVRPYAFQFIEGSDDVSTQIFNSWCNSWTTKSSQQYGMSPGHSTVAFCKGVLYIRCELDEIVIYDTEKDKWDGINPSEFGDSDDFLRGIGAWQWRVFTPSVDPKQRVIRVWELVRPAEQQESWVEIDCMPGELYSWLFYENSDPQVDVRDVQILASYCDEHILVYAWYMDEDEYVATGERFVLFNLATRTWQKLEFPFGPITEQLPSQGRLFPIV
jgi:hypothetical protein